MKKLFASLLPDVKICLLLTDEKTGLFIVTRCKKNSLPHLKLIYKLLSAALIFYIAASCEKLCRIVARCNQFVCYTAKSTFAIIVDTVQCCQLVWLFFSQCCQLIGYFSSSVASCRHNSVLVIGQAPLLPSNLAIFPPLLPANLDIFPPLLPANLDIFLPLLPANLDIFPPLLPVAAIIMCWPLVNPHCCQLICYFSTTVAS